MPTIKDDGDAQTYFASIPNLIDDMDLSVYAYRLYGHLKRVIGASGKGVCYKSTRMLAEQCRMSMGKVSEAKRELEEAGLIVVQRQESSQWKRDQITLVDVWPRNMAAYAPKVEQTTPVAEEDAPSCSPHEQAPVHHMNTCSPHEHSVHHMNTPVHLVNTKEKPYKEQPSKEEGEGEDARESWQPQMEDPSQPPPTPTKRAHVTSSNIDPRKIGQDGLIPTGQGATPLEVYREFFDLTPTAYQIKTMMREVSDLGLWREILQKWCLAGHRSNSFDNLLDIYHHGWRTNGNGQSPKNGSPRSANATAGAYRAHGTGQLSAEQTEQYERAKRRQAERFEQKVAELAATGRTSMSNMPGNAFRLRDQ
jgi:hypothetical protein